MHITGNDILRLRTQLQLTQPQLASLIGVSPSTVSRWEKKPRDGKLPMDPLQLRLLTALEGQLQKKAQDEREAFVSGITTALLVRGGLFAIYKLLEAVFADE